MQLIEYEFTAEMGIGDYRDRAFTMTEVSASPRDAIIEMVASRVEEFAREQSFEVAKARAEQYISHELGTRDWTPEQFCDGWIELWASDCQLIRVYAMEATGMIESSNK